MHSGSAVQPTPLDVTYDNDKGVATLRWQGDTVQLPAQPAASGIWYKNETYELRGKGNDLTLQKNGEVVYEHEDDHVHVVARSNDGDELHLSFNNTAGTAKAYLNGGPQIDLVAERAASGIWYTNADYELSGKGDSYQLKKNDEVVFED